MVTIFGWKITQTPSGHYVLTADRVENHPVLGSGPFCRTSPIEVLDLTRGFAVTRSGTHYVLAA
jgi:hypothetical protein